MCNFRLHYKYYNYLARKYFSTMYGFYLSAANFRVVFIKVKTPVLRYIFFFWLTLERLN